MWISFIPEPASLWHPSLSGGQGCPWQLRHINQFIRIGWTPFELPRQLYHDPSYSRYDWGDNQDTCRTTLHPWIGDETVTARKTKWVHVRWDIILPDYEMQKRLSRRCSSGGRTFKVVLHRLDWLTEDEARTTAAQTLEVVYGLFQNMKDVVDGEKIDLAYACGWVFFPLDGKTSINHALDVLSMFCGTTVKQLRGWLSSRDHAEACKWHEEIKMSVICWFYDCWLESLRSSGRQQVGGGY